MTRLGNTIVAAATVLVAAAACFTAPARAGSVVLWACHGPGGEALGEPRLAVRPLLSSGNSGDGRAEDLGGGCKQRGGVLSATFSRPDPAVDSEASWRLEVPEGLALESVRVERAVSGFGDTAMPGDPQWYEAETSSEPLESLSLESGDPPLEALFREPAKGGFVRLRVGCGPASGLQRCEAPRSGETVGVEISSFALGVRDDTPPSGPPPGGVQSPASGTLNLGLYASDTGLGLAGAEASLEDGPSGFVRLGSGACPEHPSPGATIEMPLGAAGAECPESVSGARLSLNIASVPDGEHTLRVSVTDAAGNTATLVDEPIVVDNERAPTGTEATALIGIGGGSTATSTGAPAPAGGVQGSFSSSTPGGKPVACQLPDLSMRLVSKPLRYAKHHVPVLLARRHYVFRGHLTCLLHNRRVSAPTGIVLRVLYKLPRHTYASGRGTMTVHDGNLRAILAYYSARTIVFRYEPGNGEFAQVKIPVEVVHDKAKKGKRR